MIINIHAPHTHPLARVLRRLYRIKAIRPAIYRIRLHDSAELAFAWMW